MTTEMTENEQKTNRQGCNPIHNCSAVDHTSVEPGARAYMPAGHAVQFAAISREKYPAGHSAQLLMFDDL